MIVHLKNPKDNLTFPIAKVANTEGFEKFLKDSFDIFQVNKNLHLLIFKEIAVPENPRYIFVGCFDTPEEVSKHIGTMFELKDEEAKVDEITDENTK